MKLQQLPKRQYLLNRFMRGRLTACRETIVYFTNLNSLITRYRQLTDLPHFDKDATEITYDLWHGYRKLDRDGNQAVFPFGFGRSYTTFALNNLRPAATEIDQNGIVTIRVELSNIGDTAGARGVELHVGPRTA